MKSAFAVTIFLALLAPEFRVQASPILERGVRDYLSRPKAFAQSPLSVIVTYRAPGNMRLTESGRRAQTLELQRMVFKSPVFSLSRHSQKPLWIINGSSAQLNRVQLEELSQNPRVSSIFLAGKKIHVPKENRAMASGSAILPFTGHFTDGLKRIRLPELLARSPHLTGAGVRVGVLDTGIDDTHPDLKGKLKIYRDFSPAQEPIPGDGFGHGTHVAGTIAGGAASGTAIGVAPAVDLIVGRIFDENGESTREEILNAMQWIADPDGDPSTPDHPQIVNSSWSDDDPYADREPDVEPFCIAIDRWVNLGIVPVFSAGNTGPSEATINLPAGCPSSLSVGATEQYDRSPWFSSSGPARWKSVDLPKPEVVAPGMNIISALPRGQYKKMSGTSMAAPHASGLLALILQANPTWTVPQLKKALIDGVKDLGDPGHDYTFGWGRIDAIGSSEVRW